MRTLTSIICISFLCLTVYSCKTRIQYVPVETFSSQKDNKEKFTKDSIRITEMLCIKDSINVRDSIVYKVNEKGDIISKEIYMWKERYRENNYLLNQLQSKYDSLLHIKQDSSKVKIAYPVPQYIEVNQLNGWQNFLIWCGGISILVLFGYLGVRFIRKKIKGRKIL